MILLLMVAVCFAQESRLKLNLSGLKMLVPQSTNTVHILPTTIDDEDLNLELLSSKYFEQTLNRVEQNDKTISRNLKLPIILSKALGTMAFTRAAFIMLTSDRLPNVSDLPKGTCLLCGSISAAIAGTTWLYKKSYNSQRQTDLNPSNIKINRWVEETLSDHSQDVQPTSNVNANLEKYLKLRNTNI